LQLAASHAVVSVTSFNVGLALGEVASLLLALAVLRGLFDRVLGPSLGVIVLSALLGHAAWHWMTDRSGELWHELGHAVEAGVSAASAIAVASWLLPAIILGGAAFFVPRRFDGDPIPSLLPALLGRRSDESPRG